jgi:hypothetical protein
MACTAINWGYVLTGFLSALVRDLVQNIADVWRRRRGPFKLDQTLIFPGVDVAGRIFASILLDDFAK